MSLSSPRVGGPLQRLVAVLVAGCALALTVTVTPAVHAETAPAAAAKALPLKASFRKDKKAEAGQYVLTLKNTSDAPLKVTAQVLLAVAFHATDKARNLPEETIAPGKSWKITDLAVDDKITVKADGYEPLQLVVKAKKSKDNDKERAEK